MSEREAVVVTGMGVVSALGDSAEALHAALCAGKSGLGPPPTLEWAAAGCRVAGALRDFRAERYLGEDANLRPLDRTGRLLAVAAGLALADSGWTAERRSGSEIGLVAGTLFGSLATVSGFDCRALTAGPSYVKPLDFANTVFNAAAGQTAIWHRLGGLNATLSGATAGLEAIAYAARQIAAGRADVLLAGGVEELCGEGLLAFARAGLLCGADGSGGDARPIPFGAQRNGFALGEGAALLVLESADRARRRGARILGTVGGTGLRFDPSRGEDEEALVAALAAAVGEALGESGLAASDVDAWSAAANGGRLDIAEALGVMRALGPSAAHLPVAAVKGQLGECLGASGALQVVTLIESARAGKLPGIPGLEQPDPRLALPLAGPAPREIRLRHGLATSLGLDGQVAALLIDLGEVQT